MKIGTKSILFGAHQFLLHPLFLALAWWRLFGFPWDPRLWVAFFVHDLGYWGKPNMDGREGELHPLLGASIMRQLFDRESSYLSFICPHPDCDGGVLEGEEAYIPPDGVFPCPICEPVRRKSTFWGDFTLYHSRFMARRHDRQVSPLCVADKFATVITPRWLYLLLVNLTGEIHEYMGHATHKEGAKYATMGMKLDGSQRQWCDSMKDYLRRWVHEHKDGRADSWTPTALERSTL